MHADPALIAAMHRAGRTARINAVQTLASGAMSFTAFREHVRAAGRHLRLSCDNAAPSPSSFILHPSSLRAALLLDIAPVLEALRIIITHTTRGQLLSLTADLANIERATLANEHSDEPWMEFLAGEFGEGLASVTQSGEAEPSGNPNPQAGKPATLSAANAITSTSRGITDALRLASERGVLPTHLDTAGLRALDGGLRERAFFSARTTSAGYVAELKKLVDRHLMAEGTDNDLAQLRVEAREMLKAFGYTPEKGFKGDAKLGIPSALPGTLRDLGSERRLNLIFTTQAALMRGLGQQLRGMDRSAELPSWELIRVVPKKAPRDWPQRWKQAGGPELAGAARMIAPKDGEVWSVLGDSAVFADALDVSHPPFAFESGMGWREVGRGELRDLGLPVPVPGDIATGVNDAAVASAPARRPVAADFIGGASTLDDLARRLREIEARSPRLTLEDIKAMK